MKKTGPSFLFYRVWQTWSNTSLGSTLYSEIHCGNYKIISVIPKRSLKTVIFEKIGQSSSEKKILADLSSKNEYSKPQGTIYKGMEGFLTFLLKIIRCISVICNRSLQTQIFEEKDYVSGKKKDNARCFLIIWSISNLKEKLIMVHNVFWYFLCQLYV